MRLFVIIGRLVCLLCYIDYLALQVALYKGLDMVTALIRL